MVRESGHVGKVDGEGVAEGGASGSDVGTTTGGVPVFDLWGRGAYETERGIMRQKQGGVYS